MSLQSHTTTPTGDNLPTAAMAAASSSAEKKPFVDRRRSNSSDVRNERRQFGSSHSGLTDEGRELASAIDQYKVQNHRRYITCDEMLAVITELGYRRD